MTKQEVKEHEKGKLLSFVLCNDKRRRKEMIGNEGMQVKSNNNINLLLSAEEMNKDKQRV